MCIYDCTFPEFSHTEGDVDGLASVVKLDDASCYFVCFVRFVDGSPAAKKTIHELREITLRCWANAEPLAVASGSWFATLQKKAENQKVERSIRSLPRAVLHSSTHLDVAEFTFPARPLIPMKENLLTDLVLNLRVKE